MTNDELKIGTILIDLVQSTPTYKRLLRIVDTHSDYLVVVSLSNSERSTLWRASLDSYGVYTPAKT